MLNRIQYFFLQLWYQWPAIFAYLLLPLSGCFFCVSFIRRCLYQCGIFRIQHFSVPVIVVGNITVGGTGKTPLVIAIAEYLQQAGYRPGIVSRGYGGTSIGPLQVSNQSNARDVGDEALLLYYRTQCPVVVARARVKAVKYLLAHTDCNVVLSDDGLQHYALGRTVEIAVMDAKRQHGNGMLLPAGPLREPVSRLQSVDYIVVNGIAENKISPDDSILQPKNVVAMELRPTYFYALQNKTDNMLCSEWADKMRGHVIHAVCGIGNPERFFATLSVIGLQIVEHAFSDHHPYIDTDFQSIPRDAYIVMTEKDAVKCQHLVWGTRCVMVLRVDAVLPDLFYNQIISKFIQH